MNKKTSFTSRAVLTASSFIALAPTLLYAAGPNLETLINRLVFYLDLALKALMGLAVLMFVWYIVQYFIRPQGGEERAEASMYLMWSIIGFFVIISFWGIVNILSNTFNLDTSSTSTWRDIGNLFPRR